MAAILGVGIVRFILTVAGLPNWVVKYASMTAMLALGAAAFATTTKTHKERLHVSFFLIFPYMVVEVLALAYTWLTGQQTIFHAEEYSLGFDIMWHTLGHLLGGLTWEPLTLFIVMEIIWAAHTSVLRLDSRE